MNSETESPVTAELALRKLLRLSKEIQRETGCGEITSMMRAMRMRPDLARQAEADERRGGNKQELDAGAA